MVIMRVWAAAEEVLSSVTDTRVEWRVGSAHVVPIWAALS